MRLFTNLLFKVTLSSMVLTAPAMINGNADDGHNGPSIRRKEMSLSFYSSEVIRKFIDHPTVTAMKAFVSVAADVHPALAALTAPAAKPMAPAPVPVAPMPIPVATSEAATARAVELRAVIGQAAVLYADMKLNAQGLDEKAFEYAWRGYHNLLKKKMIRRRAMLSICDFSQSSRSKRMYVIDVRHKKLVYRTYVAHGQNSGDEYATTFSNDPDSYKSSLGFYVTQHTYIGHNGLSLRLNGVDSGYNDMALKRQIVLHGSTYVSDRYIQDFGTMGTSLGCPAIPQEVSRRIIHLVRNGSCLFIYHPTPEYLVSSTVLNW